MLRRYRIAHVALMTIVLFPALESQTADAQLFRRLRSRIQASRAQQPSYQPPARPQYIPGQQSGLQRAQPQVVRPVTPPAQTTQPTPAQRPKPAGAQTSKKTPADSEQFGDSILDRPSDSAADSQQAADDDAPAPITQRPSLGIQVIATRQGIPGLQVAGFRDESLADEAGLKQGDVIVAVNGKATPTVADIAKQIEGMKGGDRVRARIVRGKTTTAIMIPLLGPGVVTTRPPVDAANPAAVAKSPIDLGIQLNDSPDYRGVIVSSVAADSPAAIGGLKVGDRIVSIDGRLMVDHKTFEYEMAKRKPGEELSLQLVRNNRLVAAEITVAGPNGIAKTEGRAAAGNKDPSSKSSGSVLEGVGSMLGGLFGGDPNKNKTNASAEKDEMALGDDEPVDQVVYESEIERARKKLQRDPPSLEELELPPGEATPIPQKAKKGQTEEQTAQELREEIRRLEQRLKELKSKQ